MSGVSSSSRQIVANTIFKFDVVNVNIRGGYDPNTGTNYLIFLLFDRPKRSFGQGNIFTPVCHSFCSRGGLTRHAPNPPDQTPSPDQTPPDQTPPWTRHPQTRPPPDQTPHGPDTPSPPPPATSRLWNTVNDRPVRILLECTLVKKIFGGPESFLWGH